MAAVHRYRVLAADLLTGAIREEIPFQTVKYTHQLNAPGTFEGTLGMRHPKATRANLDPGRTAIHVERDGLIVWSGILWTCRAASTGMNPTLTCDAQGWWSYFKRRTLRVDKTYTNSDQLAVAQDLINYAQAQPGGNLGVVVGAQTSGFTLSATYAGVDRQNIGQVVETMAAQAGGTPSLPGGFDFAVDVAWSGASVVQTLNWYYPKRGQRLNLVADLAANLSQYEQDVDASTMANAVDAVGSGSGASKLVVTASNPNVLGTYPLLDAQTSHTYITDNPTLAAAAAADLAVVQTPLVTWPNTQGLVGNPDLMIGNFRTGDLLYFTGSDGYISAGGSWQRVTQWEVDVDEQGMETLIFTVAPEGTT